MRAGDGPFHAILFMTALFVLAAILAPADILAREEMTIMVTSNLEGRFSLEEERQDEKDGLLVLAQSMLDERKRRRVDLYLDLGNAFYPGTLSRFSFGSAMIDYLSAFSCDASLVSSGDVNIGLETLDFLGKDRSTKLLSANIVRDKTPVFSPGLIRPQGDVRLAVIGISSRKTRFDIAEKKLLAVRLEEERAAFESAWTGLKKDATHALLVTGMSGKETMEMMRANPQIGLALCGGDNNGEVYGGRAQRLDLADGRSVLQLADGNGFYIVTVVVDGAVISVKEARRVSPAFRKTADPVYAEYAQRLALWKREYRREGETVIADAKGDPGYVDDTVLTRLARRRFNAEVGVVEKDTVTPTRIEGEVRRAGLFAMVNQDYSFFVFRLRGEDLRTVADADHGMVMSGYERGSVQGYPVEQKRSYRIVATQPAFERIAKLLGRDLAYTNTWLNAQDVIAGDLAGDRLVLGDDYSLLDKRFRFTASVFLSNFIDDASVRATSGTAAPPGRPPYTYRKWGMENRIDMALYNRKHQFLLTPYMFYVRQDDLYLNNLLRGELLYTYNMYEVLRPYHKTKCDTVLSAPEGLRPVVFRDTGGITVVLAGKAERPVTMKARLGLGLEKKLNDPVDVPFYGVETIIGLNVPFLKYLSYGLQFDSFVATSMREKEGGITRIEMENGLVFTITNFLNVGIRHKLFYLYTGETRSSYRNSQIITSADLKTDFKIW